MDQRKKTDSGKKKFMEDGEIVGLYWKRSERAIEETAAKYGKLCHSVAFGVLRNNEDSEECVNDTYVRTWNSIPTDQPEHLGAYVSKIARRLAIDLFRKKSAQKRAPSTTAVLDELADSLPDEASDDFEDKLALRDALARYIASLTPENRMIFMRRYWYCDTVHAIASSLHMTDTGVKRRLGRMRSNLKKLLLPERTGSAE